MDPSCKNSLDRNSIFGNGVFNFERSYVGFHHFLSKLVEMRRKNIIHFLHFNLHLEKVLYIVVDHLQQIDQRTCVIIGPINCGHFVVDIATIRRHLRVE